VISVADSTDIVMGSFCGVSSFLQERIHINNEKRIKTLIIGCDFIAELI
jgi:hypothetical protein